MDEIVTCCCVCEKELTEEQSRSPDPEEFGEKAAEKDYCLQCYFEKGFWKLERGTQIIGRPSHMRVVHDFGYPDGGRPGFVTSGPAYNGNAYFVRYWVMGLDNKPLQELRNKGGSEVLPVENLVVQDTVPQEWVEEALKEWC